MSVRTTRARLAAVVRHAPDSPRVTEARRDHRAELLAAHIDRVVNDAPPLRADQLARLRGLLTPPPAGSAPVEWGAVA